MSNRTKLRNLLKALDPNEESNVALADLRDEVQRILNMPRQVVVKEQPIIYEGKPGEPGKTPTKEELLALIESLIPEPIKGEDAKVDLVKLRNDILSRLPHGGNANRNIAIGSNTSVLSRYTDINIKAGSNVAISYVNNDTTKYLDLTFSATGGGGSFSLISYTGAVNGVNDTFVFSSSPNVIVSDQGRPMQKVSSDGNVNWTGTTTVVLQVAPNSDLYAF